MDISSTGKYTFPCGCEFTVLDKKIKESDGLPSLEVDYYNLPLTCGATWDLLQQGKTKGVFQLETNLGRAWARRILPDNLEDLAALISVVRPGTLKCVSEDTKIFIREYDKYNQNEGGRYVKVKIKELFIKFHKNHNLYSKDIMCLNENNLTFKKTQIKNIIKNGTKKVYKPKFKINRLYRDNTKFYTLECTDDHKLLTYDRGWIELKNISIGDRVAVFNNTKEREPTKLIKGQRSFGNICFQHYKYQCIFCDWKDASLDVNHIDGNRKTNNEPDNLCFMCPNHHRMYSDGKITKQEIISAREQFKINQSNDIIWAEFLGYDYVGEKEVYDIEVEGDYHNFIAGNVVVHNCKVGDKSMTQLFADRKTGSEPVLDIHPAIHDILAKTQQILVYQEQTLKIAQKVAGFDLKTCDILRRAVGKKIPELMTQVEEKFLEGVKTTGIVTEAEGKEIWSYIRKSERYSFNASHAVSYALLGYWSAYVKYHFPLQFYTSWLTFAKEKIEPQKEVRDLVKDAISNDISIKVPSILNIHDGSDFLLKNKQIFFGIRNIKRVGDAQVKKLSDEIKKKEQTLGRTIDRWEWMDFLIYLSPDISKTVVNNLILAGALDHFGMSRQEMLHEYSVWSELTEKEQLFVQTNLGLTLRSSLKNLIENSPKITENRKQIVRGLVIILESPPTSLVDNDIWINKTEEDLLGVAISKQKLDSCDIIDADTTCKEFTDGKKGEMTLCVEIRDVREHKIKKGTSAGKAMAFLNVEDETGALENVVLFNDKWEEYQNMLYPSNTVAIIGYKSNQNSLVVQKVKQL